MTNQSAVSEFILLGFPGLQKNFDAPISITMFFVYNISFIANSTVTLLIILKRSLHQPMYIIIGNLALSDLLFDTITLPKIIARYWFGSGSISFASCVFQMFCVHFLASLDSFIIMLMAIDRYIAICSPLRYHNIIRNKLVFLLCSFFWILAAIFISCTSVLIARLPYCGPNKIRNCYCNNISLSSLACADNSFVIWLGFVFAMSVLLIPLGIIILTYIFILRAVHLLARDENWQKAFYTCTTHLFVIALYYTPRIFVYITTQIPLTLNADINVLLLCLYTFIPHVANPIIYCLRTKDIRDILKQTLKLRLGLKINHNSK
ncbi:hypothetical protein GDO86_018899 [Hymenochirus boettgeri]|uniref:Olfactory receptor n=1 Tax=Hymenochirus boettgeri TaxID=247094 RepID=A0A8T2IEJ3_9PIPI|nr:hypothetical protein GDO86_018899 [Hymenochirus boettgeri]